MFGPSSRFPYAPERGYTPPDCPVDSYVRMLGTLGIERAVIVHGSAHGSDNRVTLDGIASMPDRCRGVAVVRPDVADQELEALSRGGIRGFRLSTMLKGGIGTEHLEAMAERVKGLGWHVVLHVDRAGEIAEVKVVEGQLAQSELTRKLARLELSRSQKVLDQRTIKSPITGIVTQRLLSAGEFVYQETNVVTLAKLDPLHVEVFVPVAHHGFIKRGAAATVHLSGSSKGDYAATVIVVDRVFDPASGTFGVRLELPNPGNRLPAGQRCRVSFTASPGGSAKGG